jgi:molybdenum cofactor cytidylyltransferase
MPGNKLLTPLDGKPVIRHTVDAVCASAAAPVFVVTEFESAKIRDVLADTPVTFLENVSYTNDLSPSLMCGVNNLPHDVDGYLVVPRDMPFVSAKIIAALAPPKGRAIVVPVHHGRQGNPVLWSIMMAEEFRQLAGDQRAKQLMVLHHDLLYELEVGSESVLTDLDIQEDFSIR